MKMRAPATGEHALVPLDESGEVVERLRRERPDREVGHAWNIPPIPDALRPEARSRSDPQDAKSPESEVAGSPGRTRWPRGTSRTVSRTPTVVPSRDAVHPSTRGCAKEAARRSRSFEARRASGETRVGG